MKYMLIAGEASGDLHAADVIAAIKSNDTDAEFRFFGGDLMAKAARRDPDLHYDEMNVMGFSEVIRKLPKLLRNLAQAKRLMLNWRPDALILIDYPSFNLKLAKSAHKLGIPVYYFISPKVWAWKEYRVKQIKRYVTRLFSILPFEVPFYAQRDYHVTYVGNPSVQEIDDAMRHLPPLRHFLQRQDIENDGRPLIALLPGSRKAEIRNNLPLMIAAAKRFPDCRYVVAAAPAVPEKFYRTIAQDPGLKLTFGATVPLLKYSQAAIVTSGTATLETALVGTPQVVCYRANGNPLTYKIMEKLLKVKFVSLPNLIVNNQVVPELLIHHCTVDNIARHLSPLLQPSPERDWQLSGYKSMRRKLGTSVAASYAAELLVADLRHESEPQPPKEQTENPKPRPKRRPRPKAQNNTDNPQPKKAEEKTENAPKQHQNGNNRPRRRRPRYDADSDNKPPKEQHKPHPKQNKENPANQNKPNPPKRPKEGAEGEKPRQPRRHRPRRRPDADKRANDKSPKEPTA